MLGLFRDRRHRRGWKIRPRSRPGNLLPPLPGSARSYSIHARKSGLRRGVSWAHHVRSNSPCEIEMAAIDHAMFTRSWDHFAQKHNALAALRENVADLINCA